MTKKSCFVISPIGPANSDIRRRADCVLEYIIKPAFSELEYKTPVRIDKEDNPEQITDSIINHILDADVVVADLSGNNPNVFYELGIRHAQSLPVIHICCDLEKLPFDTANQNIITYIHDDPSSHRAAIQRIVKQVSKFNEENYQVSNPVTRAVGYKKLETSGDSEKTLIAKLIRRMESLEQQIARNEPQSALNPFTSELRTNLHQIAQNELTELKAMQVQKNALRSLSLNKRVCNECGHTTVGLGLESPQHCDTCGATLK